MKSVVGHIQINIDAKNLPFYRDLMAAMEWPVVSDEPNVLGVDNGTQASVWFTAPATKASNDYDGPGMNHLAFHVSSQADVDTMVAFLQEHGVKALFNTPCHRPEFSPDPEHTYYQVMFESPDRILFEVVYLGPFNR